MAGPELYLSASLISMYSRCRLIEHADQDFEKAKKNLGYQGILLWNFMVAGYLENEHVDKA